MRSAVGTRDMTMAAATPYAPAIAMTAVRLHDKRAYGRGLERVTDTRRRRVHH